VLAAVAKAYVGVAAAWDTVVAPQADREPTPARPSKPAAQVEEGTPGQEGGRWVGMETSLSRAGSGG